MDESCLQLAGFSCLLYSVLDGFFRQALNCCFRLSFCQCEGLIGHGTAVKVFKGFHGACSVRMSLSQKTSNRLDWPSRLFGRYWPFSAVNE